MWVPENIHNPQGWCFQFCFILSIKNFGFRDSPYPSEFPLTILGKVWISSGITHLAMGRLVLISNKNGVLKRPLSRYMYPERGTVLRIPHVDTRQSEFFVPVIPYVSRDSIVSFQTCITCHHEVNFIYWLSNDVISRVNMVLRHKISNISVNTGAPLPKINPGPAHAIPFLIAVMVCLGTLSINSLDGLLVWTNNM